MTPKVENRSTDTAMTEFLRVRIEGLSVRKTQREIAAEAGYDKPNIISMFKRGDSRVPLEKVPALAKALETDVGHLFRLALQQYGMLPTIVNEIFGNNVSNNEMEWIKKIRQLTQHQDPPLTGLREKGLEEFFNKPTRT